MNLEQRAWRDAALDATQRELDSLAVVETAADAAAGYLVERYLAPLVVAIDKHGPDSPQATAALEQARRLI